MNRSIHNKPRDRQINRWKDTNKEKINNEGRTDRQTGGQTDRQRESRVRDKNNSTIKAISFELYIVFTGTLSFSILFCVVCVCGGVGVGVGVDSLVAEWYSL